MCCECSLTQGQDIFEYTTTRSLATWYVGLKIVFLPHRNYSETFLKSHLASMPIHQWLFNSYNFSLLHIYTNNKKATYSYLQTLFEANYSN